MVLALGGICGPQAVSAEALISTSVTEVEERRRFMSMTVSPPNPIAES